MSNARRSDARTLPAGAERLLARAARCTAGAAALSFGLRAGAQPPVGVPLGARVRVLLPDSLRQVPFAPRAQALVGTLTRATPDTLYLAIPTAAGVLALPRGAVRGFAVSRGASRARSALDRALYGAAIWASAAALADRDPVNRGARVAAFGLGGAAVGAVIGAASPFERWRRVRL